MYARMMFLKGAAFSFGTGLLLGRILSSTERILQLSTTMATPVTTVAAAASVATDSPLSFTAVAL